MNRPTVALCMIVKNEAENLPRVIASVEGCFDEIHITDTGSTDNTVQISKDLGCSVHHFEWVNDFSAARNYSFSHATTDYIFWMDGDDLLESKEGFIEFRDNVMNLADYWMATYHYTSDAAGKSLCSFLRERVIKNNRGFTWDYPIHEGIKPISSYGPARAQFTQAWSIRHQRSAEDLAKDKSRNLNIFKTFKEKGVLDARMKYYYGKELFEANQPVESIQYFLQATADTNLEMHDRILGIQYTCYAYIQCNQHEKAIEMAHLGLQLAPHRAEYHTVIADAYLKLGNLWSAIPFYQAAKDCEMHAPTSFGPAIFKAEYTYTTYPRTQLAKIYAQLGNFDKARESALACYEKYKDPESSIILGELNKMSKFEDYSNAKPCDDIVIACPPGSAYEWDADLMKEKAMGGSETAAIQMGYWLHKLSGRPVKIFNMRTQDKVCDGVEYISANKLATYMVENKPYVCVNWRHATKITNAPTFVWSHDLTTPGVESGGNYNKVMCLTPFHKKYMTLTQGVPEDKIYVTRNGIDPSRFMGDRPGKDPFRFVFGSSPDRGLVQAMFVLDKVREKYPEVTLHIYYGIEHLDKYGLKELRLKLEQMIIERKDWVTYHGATKQDDLIKEYQKSAYNVQPSDWLETSCISALELVLSGVYPIFRDIAGVSDTLKEFNERGMCTLVNSECITEIEKQRYVDAAIDAIENKKYLNMDVSPEKFSWESVAKSWLEDLPKMFESKV